MKVLVSRNPYGCGICDETFSQPKSLAKHVETFHSEPRNGNHGQNEAYIKAENENCEINAKSETKNDNFIEKEEKNTTAINPRFEKIKISIVKNDDIIKNEFKLEDKSEHELNQCLRKDDNRVLIDEKSIKCNHCNKEFQTTQRKKLHERIHTGERPFLCNVCNKTFTSKVVLKQHERIHTGEKPFQCNFCDKKFTQLAVKVRHVRTHTGEKPYSCQYCNTTFTLQHARKDHERLHTGEKPYACAKCSKCFSSPSYRRHHAKTCRNNLDKSLNKT